MRDDSDQLSASCAKPSAVAFLILLGALPLTTLVTTTPAAADWLVLRDGSRVETEGAWEVKGRQVIFTQPNGPLSALRASDVDLEASDQATALAKMPPTLAAPSVEEPAPEPVLVLTNKDIPQAVDPASVFELKPEVVPQASDREPVQVISWRRTDGPGGGLEIRGSVRNTGSSLAANINIRAEVKSEEGEVLGFGNAFLGTASLISGRSTNFRIPLPDVFDFAGDPVFTVSSSELTVGGAPRERARAPREAGGETDPGEAMDDGDDVGDDEGELIYLPMGKPSPEFAEGSEGESSAESESGGI